MSEHCGYIVRVEHLRPHTNADRLQIATFFGNDTIVDLSVKEGDLGVYFPSDLQLSEQFCETNNLVRKKDENGNDIGGYLDPDKRNVKAIRLRGEKSDGMYLPIRSLESFCDVSTLKPGDKIDVINGTEICRKYIPRSNGYTGGRARTGNTSKKKKSFSCPTFYEHVDTEQLRFHMDEFKTGDVLEYTLKMHGTSQRTGYLPVTKELKRPWWRKLLRLKPKTVTEYGYVTGTRRTVLDEYNGPSYYEDDSWRVAMAKKFEGKLNKGETVYYEVVGFQGPLGKPIMATGDNRKLKDKEFVKKYGETTVFSYGCEQENDYYVEHPCCEAYIYRMTMVNEDGYVVEYTPDFMRYRCQQMHVKTVPVLAKVAIRCDSKEQINDEVMAIAEECCDGPDPVGGSHVREGTVVRIVNRPAFTAFKHKNYSFKVLEGIIKEAASEPDIEEAQEVNESV